MNNYAQTNAEYTFEEFDGQAPKGPVARELTENLTIMGEWRRQDYAM